MTFPVDFYQNRVGAVFYVADPVNFFAVKTSATTSDDEFYLLIFFSDEAEPAAEHYTFCCSTVSGVDQWFIKLANGWQIPWGNDTYLVEDYDTMLPMSPSDFLWFDHEDGVTDCGGFSSGDGYINDLKSVPPPAGYQAEVDVDWTAGSNCSGIAYAVHLRVYGPDGLPFE